MYRDLVIRMWIMPLTPFFEMPPALIIVKFIGTFNIINPFDFVNPIEGPEHIMNPLFTIPI